MTSISGKEDTGLRFRIDTDLCAGHGRCYALDPDHFEADDVGYAVVLDKVEPAAKRGDMQDIVMACPEGAILIEDVSGD
ncbi:ferredoxin [Prauserella cavernicola]|uniref:Ferredoxin n=1 Tax=Prauserella cavernicola TaxID=2800127 RepID=A0A934QV66_9PSEU|nr:ferredoxin [Prauserella cavernicola]MBK1787110.1 ferredoxin [Prauserella cavernicola]